MSFENSENFPRGGKRSFPANETIKRKHEDNLFSIEHQPKSKKTKKAKQDKQKTTNTETAWHSTLKCQGTLTYNTIQEGMIILSCVRHISNLALQIEFPGLTFGLITINRISDTFTELLTRQLQEGGVEESCAALKKMFNVGQLVPAKIMTVTNTEKGHEVHASLNPKDINMERMHSSFRKGMLIWANVVSELDHGYELSVGVRNCRVFLPFKNIDDNKKYSIGELLYCIIHKSETSATATTLTVSAKEEHIDKIQLKEGLNLHDLLPGTKVEFIVENISKHGIKGQFENCFGYLDETQIFSKINLGIVTEGSTIPSYVLFVEPITKVTYLTLRNLRNLPHPQYELGKIMTAEVLSTKNRGVYVKLGKNATGFVTNKRLLNTLPKTAELDVVNSVRTKYPVESKRQCRILAYNHMQELYICTFEQKIVKEKIFKVTDLTLGQIVQVQVDKIVPNGLVLKAGHVQGFVPNLHLSNVKYSNNIKGKFTVGMTVNARVLNVSENNVIFTLKQGLLEAESLTSYEDATPNSQFVGFVVQTKIAGVLIGFLGGVKGWIGNKMLNYGNSGGYMDPRDYFFLGQVVHVWILGFRNDKLQLSLCYPGDIKKKKLKIGQNSTGFVTAVHSNGLDVDVGKNGVEATIPVLHLGPNPLLCPILLKTYSVGDAIPNLMCVKNTNIPIMSRREFVAYKENKIKVPKFDDLRKEMILRCSFEKKTDSGIYVTTPILDYHEDIHISKTNLPADESYDFKKQQCILAKVINVDYEAKDVVLDVTASNTLDRNISKAANILTKNIEDLNNIIEHGQKKNWKMTQYKIGERVKCEVQNIDKDGSCFVTLPNGTNALIPFHLQYPFNKLESTIEGVVIDYNFIEEQVLICCRSDLKQKINKLQGVDINKPLQSSCMAEILLITKFYALGVLKDSQCNRQLAYLPLFYSKRDPSRSIYEEGAKIKVVLHRQVCNRIIALPKKFAPPPEKKELKVKKEKKTVKEEIVEESESMDVDEVEEESGSVDVEDDDVGQDQDSDEEIDNKSSVGNVKDEGESRSAVLSGITSFFGSDDYNNDQNSSSSDEETEEKEEGKKKKKLTPKERAELAKKEEERIAKIEKELADSSTIPQSAEQFDRLLLANPNSSELWLKYMAMHVAATELDKARAVGKKAIETINMSLDKEKFNIWVALLNMENMYGTKESFDKLFEDAVKYNDSLEIYLNVIKLLANSGKLGEMEEKIKKVRAKEKQNSKMWLEVGQVYYTLGKFREARNVKEAALKSILDKKRQFDLIVRFGIMEFQLGDVEQAIANFETILETYPSKINIWFIYVDQLVKKKKIESARKVLERAIGQKFVVKSMKAIFQKFIHFEEQHGNPEAVQEVKRKAKEYVSAVSVR